MLSSGDPRLGIPPALFFSTLPRQPAPRLRPSIKSAFDSKRSTAITVKSISQECNEPRKDRADIFRSRIIHTRVKGIIALKFLPFQISPPSLTFFASIYRILQLTRGDKSSLDLFRDATNRRSENPGKILAWTLKKKNTQTTLTQKGITPPINSKRFNQCIEQPTHWRAIRWKVSNFAKKTFSIYRKRGGGKGKASSHPPLFSSTIF